MRQETAQDCAKVLMARIAYALTLRPTGLGSGIDGDRPDYIVYSTG
jgi:hypothetical protein